MGDTLLNYTPATGFVYTHLNMHGDALTTTDAAGKRTWSGLTGPFGEVTSSTVPANTPGAGTRLGWHANDQRITDRNITLLGARPYMPSLGRFLSVDPIPGGCANAYTYVYGDPVNTSDTSGLGICLLGHHTGGGCIGGSIVKGLACWVDDNWMSIASITLSALSYVAAVTPGLQGAAAVISVAGGVVAAGAFVKSCVKGDPNSQACHLAMAALGIAATDLLVSSGVVVVKFTEDVAKALAVTAATVTVAGAGSARCD